MSPYQNMQEALASAAREQQRQRKKAASIMDKLASECVSNLEIPLDNINFTKRQQPGESFESEGRGYPSSEFVIERDNEGTWSANMEIKVDPGPEINVYATTIVQVEVTFPGPFSEGEPSLKGQEVAVKLSGTQAEESPIAGIVDQIAGRIFKTSEWFATGVGKKPAMGFDSIRRK